MGKSDDAAWSGELRRWTGSTSLVSLPLTQKSKPRNGKLCAGEFSGALVCACVYRVLPYVRLIIGVPLATRTEDARTFRGHGSCLRADRDVSSRRNPTAFNQGYGRNYGNPMAAAAQSHDHYTSIRGQCYYATDQRVCFFLQSFNIIDKSTRKCRSTMHAYSNETKNSKFFSAYWKEKEFSISFSFPIHMETIFLGPLD